MIGGVERLLYLSQKRETSSRGLFQAQSREERLGRTPQDSRARSPTEIVCTAKGL